MANLYALLVGINEYAPGSGVRNLRGCQNDVEAMKAFLQEAYSGAQPKIHTLLNAKATRANLIKTFTDQLIEKPKAGDIVLFYYSGHGSYENTSEVFERFDGRNKNETLVCHDSRLPDQYDLADKELAVLINEIPDGVQKVIVLDSCHSGSATRSVDDDEAFGLSRQHPGRTDKGYKRPLNSYFLSEDNYYTKQQAQGGQISVPMSQHILLSSCDRDETALETNERRGLFSTNLIKVLQEKKTLISYNQLFLEVRRAVLNTRENQNPKVEPFMGFNGNLRFLSNEAIDSETYPVAWDEHNRAWVLEQGAVHGLPTAPTEIAAIGLILKEDQEAADGKMIPAGISVVKIDKSYVSAEGLDKSKKYLATINSLPRKLALRVWLNGPKEQQQAFLKHYEKVRSPYIEIDAASKNGCRYEIRMEADQIKVIHIPSGLFIQGANVKENGKLQLAACAEDIATVLNQIEKWERLRNLDKEPTHLSREQIKIRFQEVESTPVRNDRGRIVDRKLDRVIQTFPTNEIRVGLDYAGKRDGRDIWKSVGFRITLENHSDTELYFHLLYFSRKYKIAHYSMVQIPGNSDEEYELLMNTLLISSKEPELTEVVDVFKVITSTEQLTPTQFTQEGFKILGEYVSRDRDIGDEEEYEAAPLEDWFTTTFTVTVAKNLTQVGKSASSKINGLQFKGNDKVKAKVTFGAINANTRTAEPIYQLPDLLKGSGLEIMDFSSERSDMDKSIVELSDISGDEDLRNNPLEIELDRSLLSDKEALFPVTFDGEFIIPIGGLKDDGKMTIEHFPETSRERSVGKALKFVFLKTFFKDKVDVFKLRWFDYDSKKKDKRTDAEPKELKKKVEAAGKILMVVHGIIGNTKQMAEEAEFAVKEKGFDLVLTFDYENLDTPIPEIAEALDKDLTAIGLGAGHGKAFHIVAHSMGGLVTRYMIENVREDDGSVQRLIMFGTPNGGSRFGDIPGKVEEHVPEAVKEVVRDKAKEWFNLALGVALNFLPGYVKTILDTGKELLKRADIQKPKVLETLVMMSAESDFIKQLKTNQAPANTAYYIVAGTIEEYVVDGKKGWFGRFLEKVELGVGKSVYYGTPNDIAVSTQQILEVKGIATEHTATVACHHLVYFENEESVAKWREWV